MLIRVIGNNFDDFGRSDLAVFAFNGYDLMAGRLYGSGFMSIDMD